MQEHSGDLVISFHHPIILKESVADRRCDLERLTQPQRGSPEALDGTLSASPTRNCNSAESQQGTVRKQKAPAVAHGELPEA
ncbi:hypothetical protein KCU83_g224, partial [Aureobasidium melanogenum]